MTTARSVGKIVVGTLIFEVTVAEYSDGEGGTTSLITVTSNDCSRSEQSGFSEDARILNFARGVAKRAIDAKPKPLDPNSPGMSYPA